MIKNDNLALLKLMSLISPTLPIGGFSYSQGIEPAVENNWITNLEDGYHWLMSQLEYGLQTTDLAIMYKLYQFEITEQHNEFNELNNMLLVLRETQELQKEELNKGGALISIANKLDNNIALHWNLDNNTFLAIFTLLGKHWNISIQDLMLGYSWAWLENQVSSIVKIIPLGQSDGQKLLHNILLKIPEIVEKSMQLDDKYIGQSQHGLAIISSKHETQYTRIYRS